MRILMMVLILGLAAASALARGGDEDVHYTRQRNVKKKSGKKARNIFELIFGKRKNKKRGGLFAPKKSLLRNCQGRVHIRVSKSRQRMQVFEQCELVATFLVSTGLDSGCKKKNGRIGSCTTPNFRGHPIHNPKGYLMGPLNYSTVYPEGRCTIRGQKIRNMGFAIYYRPSYAIHGTCAENNLGRKASHGCTRTKWENAVYIQNLIIKHGGRLDTLYMEIQNGFDDWDFYSGQGGLY